MQCQGRLFYIRDYTPLEDARPCPHKVEYTGKVPFKPLQFICAYHRLGYPPDAVTTINDFANKH